MKLFESKRRLERYISSRRQPVEKAYFQADFIAQMVYNYRDEQNAALNRGEVEQIAYHTACDEHGYVLETVVTAGNVHDSVAFDDVYDKVTESFPQVQTIVADSAYKTPHICKKVFGDDRVLSTAHKRPMTMKGGHEWWKYAYDEYYDCAASLSGISAPTPKAA